MSEHETPGSESGSRALGADDDKPLGAADPTLGTTGMTEDDLGPAPGGTDDSGPMLRPGAPVRHVGPPPGTAPPGGPVGPAGPAHLESQHYEIAQRVQDPVEDRRAERRVALVFLTSVIATVAFLTAYIAMKIHTPDYGAAMNYTLGITLGVALFALGAGLVLWAKTLIPKEYAVSDRHDGPSSPKDRREAEEAFLAGAERLGIARRPLILRTMMLAVGVLPLSAVVLLRDLGPAPEKRLRSTAWRAGKRLVDVETKVPVRLGDLRIGAIQTVLPEGYENLEEKDWALAPTILIRMRPGELRPPTNLNWTVDGHVAYSKVCTHAGCPTSLYEQQTKHLLCPCHQSTFLADEGCRVIFGPAARPLPQLPIAADEEGYLIATSDYREPVGPSFWERG